MRHLGIAYTETADDERLFVLPFRVVIRANIDAYEAIRSMANPDKTGLLSIVPSDSDNDDVPTTSLDASVMLLGYVTVFTC